MRRFLRGASSRSQPVITLFLLRSRLSLLCWYSRLSFSAVAIRQGWSARSIGGSAPALCSDALAGAVVARCAARVGLAVLCCLVLPAVAGAQVTGERTRVALLSTNTVKSGPAAERASSIRVTVRKALARMDGIDIVAAPALDLQAIQLSLDCVGETADCLGAVARQLDADVLVAPAVHREDAGLVLDILYFDARSASEPRRALRRQAGNELSSDTLDRVPDMLRELFGAEATSAVASGDDPAAAVAPQASAPAAALPPVHDHELTSEDASFEPHGEPRASVPLGPVLLGAAGLTALGAGAVFGVLARDTEDAYARAEIQTPAQAAAARDKLDTGRGQALASTVLLSMGTAALVAGGVWLAVDLGSRARQLRLALAPSFAPGRAQLTLSGAWGGGS